MTNMENVNNTQKSISSLRKKFKKIAKNPFFNTISANEKKLEKLSELSKEIDSNVLGIAPKRFIIGKEKKLEKLSELKYIVDASKVETEHNVENLKRKRENSFITKLIDTKNTVTDVLTKEIKPLEILKKSLIDKKYIGKDSEEILSMVYKKEKPKKEKTNDVSETFDPIKNGVEAYKLSEVEPKTINTPAVSDNDTDEERIIKIEDRLDSIDKNIVLLSKTIEEASKRSIDNQDTSIDEVRKKPNAVVSLSQQQQIMKEPEKKDESFWSSLFSKLFSGWLASKVGAKLLFSAVSTAASWAVKKAANKLGSILSSAKEFAKNTATKLNSMLGSAKDFIKDKVTKVSDSVKTKVSAVKDKVSDVTKRRGAITKQAEKLTDNAKSKATVVIKKISKFSKVIPILGTVVAAGSAVYSAVEGYNNAGEILGKPDGKLTETEKLSAAAGNVVSDLSFGFISPSTVANKIISVFGSEDKPDDQSNSGSEPAEKVDMEIPLDLSNASPEEKIIIRKIQNVKQYITDDEIALRNETNQDRIKVKKERKAKYTAELLNLFREYNEKFYTNKPDVYKDDSIIKVNQYEESTVQNTKQFNRQSAPTMPISSGGNMNLNINNQMQDLNFRAFDMFDIGE